MKKIILGTICSVLLYSCGEFLTPKSQNEYVPKTVEALEEVLIGGVYPNTSLQISNLFTYHEIFSDDISTLADPDAAFQALYIDLKYKAKRIYGMNPDITDPLASDGVAKSDQCWEMYFKQILSCNTVLDYIGSVSGDEVLRNRVIAEAHLFRAFYYFNFVNIYGKPYNSAPDSPGVPLKLTAQYSPELIARSSVGEVYAQIIKDLDAAENYYSKFDEDYYNFVSKPSAPLLYALRSRVALYMEDWKGAKHYAEKVMKSRHKFSLYDLNTFIPTTKAPYPSYTNVENVNCETIYSYGKLIIDNETVFIKAMTGINKTGSELGLRYFVPSPELLNSYDGQSDLRKSRYIVLEYCAAPPMVGPIENYYQPLGKSDIDGQYSTPQDSKAFSLSFRLSEVYLNYAEACAKLGGENKILAINSMRDLLTKRYVSGTAIDIKSSSDEELVEFIRQERRKELCFEGHRWFDQRRCGMKGFEKLWYESGKVTSIIKIENNDPAFTMLIPNAVLLNNIRLVQNDLWSKKY